MEKRGLFNLGQKFHEWHKTDKLKFVCGKRAKNVEAEIKRVFELINYINNKKKHLELEARE